MKKLFTLISALSLTAISVAQPLVNQSQLINFPGGGSGGANASATQTVIGHTLYGSGNQTSANNWMAEKIVVPASGWTVDSLIVYGYQTGSTTVSTFTALNAFISADSSNFPGYTPVLGSRTVSSLIGTNWSGIYRTPNDDAASLMNTQRPIMRLKSSISGNLTAGTYWIVWNTAGTGASGPWCPPVTILNQATTGNALQFLGTSSTWTTMVSGGFNQGAPFILHGKITTSVKETVAAANEISIAPSPFVSSANVNITLAENAGVSLSDLSFEMYDVTCKMVMQNSNINNSTFTIERGDLSAGTYTYKVINNSNGVALKTGKVAIQ